MPAVVAGTNLVTAVTGIQVGRAVANMITTGAWRFPPVSRWVSSIPGLFGGDAAAGLTPRPGTAAAPWVLVVAVVTVEVVLLILVGALAVLVWRRWDPHQPGGFATREQIRHVLGTRRLHTMAPLIRPDLHQVRKVTIPGATPTDPTIPTRRIAPGPRVAIQLRSAASRLVDLCRWSATSRPREKRQSPEEPAATDTELPRSGLPSTGPSTTDRRSSWPRNFDRDWYTLHENPGSQPGSDHDAERGRVPCPDRGTT